MHAPPLAPGVTRESFLLSAEPGRALERVTKATADFFKEHLR